MPGPPLQRAHLACHLRDRARIVGGAFLEGFEKHLVAIGNSRRSEVVKHLAPRGVDPHRTVEILRGESALDMRVQKVELGKKLIFRHRDLPHRLLFIRSPPVNLAPGVADIFQRLNRSLRSGDFACAHRRQQLLARIFVETKQVIGDLAALFEIQARLQPINDCQRTREMFTVPDFSTTPCSTSPTKSRM